MRKEGTMKRHGFGKALSFAIIAIAAFVCLLTSNYACADEFGILSESYLYPDGLRLEVDSKLQWWDNIATTDDLTDVREGNQSLIGYVLISDYWFGFGIIWDPNLNDIADPKDMSAYANGSLNFWVKTQTPLKIGIKDSTGTERWVNLNDPPFSIPSDDQWRLVSIPMNTYFNGIDFSKVTQLFMVGQSILPTAGMLTFHFDNVRWDTEQIGPLDHITIYPSPWTIPTGLPKAFIARGYDINNNAVDVYPSWTNPGVTGSFITGDGSIAIFSSSAVSGPGNITATYNAISGNANVQVSDIVWNDFFNLFLDAGLYGSLGTYDSDGAAAGNDIAIETVTNEYPPGYEKSLKATYTITDDGNAGFFIQEGELTDPVSTKDVSSFQDGYLHFWVKTPVDLQISLRSGNVQDGEEMSRVLLSKYNVAADNNWHEVYIALDDFKIWDGRLDLAQTKVFFNAGVVGKFVSNYADIFYLSNIRYVGLKTPPPIPSLSVQVKRRSDDQVEPTGEISWAGVDFGDGWLIADQYLEVAYETVDPSWGTQIYTDNMGPGASPMYGGDPQRVRFEQPTGLIGEIDTFVHCPMAWMALDVNSYSNNLPIPVEVPNAFPESHPDHRIYFVSDTGGMWPGGVDAQGEWVWLKDLSNTIWDDKDADLILDITGNFGDPNYELVADFSTLGEEYATFLDPNGLFCGWFEPPGGDEKIYLLNPEPPVFIYFAAKFSTARILQKYETNTITLELYHY